jgi:DNA-binding MarR family transcriptional regulator
MNEMPVIKKERHPLADIDRVVHAPARLMVLTYLYVVEKADYTFLMNLTGLTWGNLSSHITKMEEAHYVEIEKEFVARKPHTLVKLTEQGRAAFEDYKKSMRQILGNVSD